MYQNENYSTQYQLDVRTALNAYLVKVFGKMFAGLAITAVTAFYFAAGGLAYSLGYGAYLVMLLELVLVIALSAGINKLSYGAAVGMFITYSFLNGITLSFIFLVYDIGDRHGVYRNRRNLRGYGALRLYYKKRFNEFRQPCKNAFDRRAYCHAC